MNHQILSGASFTKSRVAITIRSSGHIADLPLPQQLLDRLIEVYKTVYKVDMADYMVPPGGFKTFDQFFTRRLKDGARPIVSDPNVLVSPCDGRIQEFGKVTDGMMFQAKGRPIVSANCWVMPACVPGLRARSM